MLSFNLSRKFWRKILLQYNININIVSQNYYTNLYFKNINNKQEIRRE